MSLREDVLVPPTVISLGAVAVDTRMLFMVAAVVVAIALGALWRSAQLYEKKKSWADVRSDLIVSVMIGGANTVLCLAIVDLLGVGILLAMGIGVIIGATGVRALPMLRTFALDMMRQRLSPDPVAQPQWIPPELPPEMQDQLRRLDALDRGEEPQDAA